MSETASMPMIQVGKVLTATPTESIKKRRQIYSEAILKIDKQFPFQEIYTDIRPIILTSEKLYELDPSFSLDNQKEIERKINFRIYNKFKDVFQERYQGKFIIIAFGQIQAVENTLDDVKDVAVGAKHRLIFKVEPEEPRGTLRWPIRVQ